MNTELGCLYVLIFMIAVGVWIYLLVTTLITLNLIGFVAVFIIGSSILMVMALPFL